MRAPLGESSMPVVVQVDSQTVEDIVEVVDSTVEFDLIQKGIESQ